MNEKFGSYKDWIITALGNDRVEVNGYRVTYNDDEDFGTFDYYDEAMQYINQYIKDNNSEVETPAERAARELREKAINREKKIDQILGE